ISGDLSRTTARREPREISPALLRDRVGESCELRISMIVGPNSPPLLSAHVAMAVVPEERRGRTGPSPTEGVGHLTGGDLTLGRDKGQHVELHWPFRPSAGCQPGCAETFTFWPHPLRLRNAVLRAGQQRHNSPGGFATPLRGGGECASAL